MFNNYSSTLVAIDNINSVCEIGLYKTIIDLFHRPCLCYQLQSIEQNMCMLL